MIPILRKYFPYTIIENKYDYILSELRRKFLYDNVDNVYEAILDALRYGNIRLEYLEYITKLSFYESIILRLAKLRERYNILDKLHTLLSHSIQIKADKVIFKISKTLLLDIEAYLTGLYILHRVSDPLSLLPVRLLIATLFFDIALNYIKRALDSLYAGKPEEAKNILEHFLNTIPNNIYNYVFPMEDLPFLAIYTGTATEKTLPHYKVAAGFTILSILQGTKDTDIIYDKLEKLNRSIAKMVVEIRKREEKMP